MKKNQAFGRKEKNIIENTATNTIETGIVLKGHVVVISLPRSVRIAIK